MRKRVLSGMRPTGKLHIGHYFGALENWVRLQNARGADGGAEYECFYFIADWHALTSDYADSSAIAENSVEIAIDYLAAGIDPEKAVLFLQSSVPEHAELHLLLSMVTPLSWLERVPTYKEAFENVQDKDLHTYGFLGYPCLQTADIVIYSEPGAPLVVPVGEDQKSHVELSREIVRRFNTYFGVHIDDVLYEPARRGDLKAIASIMDMPSTTEVDKAYWRTQIRRTISQMGFDNFIDKLTAGVTATSSIESEFDLVTRRDPNQYFKRVESLVEPEVMLTATPRIPGLDGRKMSKSYGNAITLNESDEDIRAKTKVMKTDPARQRRTDPGDPEVCPVYDWHKLFSPVETLDWAAAGCRSAGIGCIECKKAMADNLIRWIEPVRERRVKWERDRAGVREIVEAGSKRARVVAQGTMERVREAVFGKRLA